MSVLQKVPLTKFCLRFLFLTSPFTSFITGSLHSHHFVSKLQWKHFIKNKLQYYTKQHR